MNTPKPKIDEFDVKIGIVNIIVSIIMLISISNDIIVHNTLHVWDAVLCIINGLCAWFFLLRKL